MSSPQLKKPRLSSGKSSSRSEELQTSSIGKSSELAIGRDHNSNVSLVIINEWWSRVALCHCGKGTGAASFLLICYNYIDGKYVRSVYRSSTTGTERRDAIYGGSDPSDGREASPEVGTRDEGPCSASVGE